MKGLTDKFALLRIRANGVSPSVALLQVILRRLINIAPSLVIARNFP
jgi:hypothetical protein